MKSLIKLALCLLVFSALGQAQGFRFRTYLAIDSSIYTSQTNAIRYLKYNDTTKIWTDIENYTTAPKWRQRIRDDGTFNSQIYNSVSAVSKGADSTYAEMFTAANGLAGFGGRRPTGSAYSFWQASYNDSTIWYSGGTQRMKLDHEGTLNFYKSGDGTRSVAYWVQGDTLAYDYVHFGGTGGNQIRLQRVVSGDPTVADAARNDLAAYGYNLTFRQALMSVSSRGTAGISVGHNQNHVGPGTAMFVDTVRIRFGTNDASGGIPHYRYYLTEADGWRYVDSTTTNATPFVFQKANDTVKSYIRRDVSGANVSTLYRTRDSGELSSSNGQIFSIINKGNDSTIVTAGANATGQFVVAGRRTNTTTKAVTGTVNDWLRSMNDSTTVYANGVEVVRISDAKLRIKSSTSNVSLEFDADASANIANTIRFTRSGSLRWLLVGSNASSGTDDFQISRYNGSGVFQDAPFKILRSNGNIEMTGSLDVIGTITNAAWGGDVISASFLPTAAVAASGIINTSAQTVSGVKTFNNGVKIGGSGLLVENAFYSVTASSPGTITHYVLIDINGTEYRIPLAEN